ncbi:hypothetical protein [Paraburkholderia youngii]|uniref:hypothetical protein n=1 Tax=Paraburkholderia youngii TaxID=2782701 RepID=UPI003D1D6F48
MSRIRTVKPELFKHWQLFQAEQRSGLPLRVAFIGLFCCVDREGRFKWRPEELKPDILPNDVLDFGAVLNALHRAGFIVRYEHEGEHYGHIPTFSGHQHINIREAKSTIPDPADPKSKCVQVQDDARTEISVGKGKEGKGREVNQRHSDGISTSARAKIQCMHVQDRASLAAAEIATALRAWERERGKMARGVTASHPHVIELADMHVSTVELRRAYDAAVADRDATNDPTAINAGFVRVFVDKHRHPQPKREDNTWRRSPSGIERKASELGIVCPPGRDHAWLAEKCDSVMRQRAQANGAAQ